MRHHGAVRARRRGRRRPCGRRGRIAHGGIGWRRPRIGHWLRGVVGVRDRAVRVGLCAQVCGRRIANRLWTVGRAGARQRLGCVVGVGDRSISVLLRSEIRRWGVSNRLGTVRRWGLSNRLGTVRRWNVAEWLRARCRRSFGNRLRWRCRSRLIRIAAGPRRGTSPRVGACEVDPGVLTGRYERRVSPRVGPGEVNASVLTRRHKRIAGWRVRRRRHVGPGQVVQRADRTDGAGAAARRRRGWVRRPGWNRRS